MCDEKSKWLQMKRPRQCEQIHELDIYSYFTPQNYLELSISFEYLLTNIQMLNIKNFHLLIKMES